MTPERLSVIRRYRPRPKGQKGATMGDLISRADAIEAVGEAIAEGCSWYDALEALPSAEAPYMFSEAYMKQLRFERDYLQDVVDGQWIPCSERLPEDGVAVLITTENEEVYIDQVITDPFKERYFQSNTAYDNFQVIAWMPLPKPYREDGEV